MFKPRVDGEIARIAREQHALISRAQLDDLNLTAKQINGAVRAERFELVLPNVLRLAGAPRTTEQRVAAAVLWGGPGAVASYRSAAGLWEIDVPEGARPEISVPIESNPRCDDVVVHRVSSPPAQRKRRGIPTTTPERTIIDLAGVLTAPQLETAFESARHERLVTADSLARALHQLGTRGRRGSASLRSLLATLADDPPAESALEVRVERLLRASALPKPQRQVEVEVDARRYRLDFAWPELLVALECDGRRWHDFEHDRRRWSAISSATGYRILWATWERVRDEPDRLIAELVAATESGRR
jgi:very-short-patch-repair endonuclease